MSKRMTLVIGALCDNGMVFCSDTEEGTSMGGKRDVHKLFPYSANDWRMIVGTAGFGPLCDVVEKRIRIKTSDADFIQKHQSKLGEVMKQLYGQYIPDTLPAQKQYDRQIQLVIGIVSGSANEKLLYQTTEEIVHPVQHQYACAGVGQEIAYYLLDRLFDQSLNYSQGGELVKFVMREAKESVGNVGGNTEMITVMDCIKGTIQEQLASGWEAKQPRLRNNINKFWIGN
jgi:20S proteasome alpha/beta subunit